MIREDHAFFVIGEWEHIRCYRNGCLCFRSYSVSLFQKSTDPDRGPSLRQLLQLDRGYLGEMGCSAGRLREQARSHKSSAAARGKAAPLNNERKLECF